MSATRTIRMKSLGRILAWTLGCVACYFLASLITPDPKWLGPALIAAPGILLSFVVLVWPRWMNKMMPYETPEGFPEAEDLTRQATGLNHKLRKAPSVRVFRDPEVAAVSSAVGETVYFNKAHFDELEPGEKTFALAASVAILESKSKRTWLSPYTLLYVAAGVAAAINPWSILIAYALAALAMWILVRRQRKSGGADAIADRRAVEMTGDLEGALSYLARRAKALPSHAASFEKRIELLKQACAS